MGSPLLFFILLLCFTTTLASPHTKPRSLHFYLHDIVTPTNFSTPTSKYVAGPSGAGGRFFGTIAVIDDKITAGKDFHSEELGRARGYYIDNSLDGQPVSLLFAFTAVFSKVYNGSTISFFGQDVISEPQRTLSVIGGTKVFDLVRGRAVFETISFHNLNAVLHFKVSLV